MHKPNAVAEVSAWLLENGHRLLLAVTGGRYPRTVMGMLTVELHTVGRKSGKPYANLLTSPVHDDDRIIVVASKGGHEDHPDWYKNAIANPDVTVTVNGATVPMLARKNEPSCGPKWSRPTRDMRAISATRPGKSPC